MDWYIWVCGVLAPFFISMILVFCVHPYIVRIAKERGLVDNPDARKQAPTKKNKVCIGSAA